MTVLSEQLDMLEHVVPLQFEGTVDEVRGMAVRVRDLPVPVGAAVRILCRGAASRRGDRVVRCEGGGMIGEVVGFDQDRTVVIPLGATAGICGGDRVVAEHFAPLARVGTSLLGRVLDARGRPIDGRGPLRGGVMRSLEHRPVDPMSRPLIDVPLATGVRAIDTLSSVGRGQRLGIFAAPGVGKSVMLGMMARNTAADVSVIALVGERGREVMDFLENQLGPKGLARSVVVCASCDEPALLRVRAATLAAAVAESFRDRGSDVLLIMDSLTRYCHALRQIGLAAGEPPTTKGYPPSVFANVPTLLERCGRTRSGSITGLFAVLVEGDDMDDPVADAARSILDGHIVLSRKLAHRGHWPAIDLLSSISRVADQVTDAEHQAARQRVLRVVSAFEDVEDLVNLGAYAAGSNIDFDVAINCKAAVDRLVCQARHEVVPDDTFRQARAQLLALDQTIGQARALLTHRGQRPAVSAPAGQRPVPAAAQRGSTAPSRPA